MGFDEARIGTSASDETSPTAVLTYFDAGFQGDYWDGEGWILGGLGVGDSDRCFFPVLMKDWESGLVGFCMNLDVW